MNEVQIIINSVACINALILFAILFFRRNNVLPNYMLAGIMAVFGLYFVNSIFLLENHPIHWLFFTVQYCAIFFIPFFSVYIYAILGMPISKLWPIFCISLLIGIIPCYLGYNYFYKYSEPQQNQFFTQLVEGPYPSEITFYSLVFYSFQQAVFVYLLLAIRKVRKKFVQFYSDIDQFKVIYLRNLTILLIVLNLSILVLYVVFDILIVEYLLLPIIITLIYIYIIYYAFRNYGIFTKEEYHLYLERISFSLREADISMPEEKTSRFREEIEHVLIEQNLSKDPEITLGKLASTMNRPMAEVSRLIRVELNSNFYDLINSRRIEEAKRMLTEGNDYTIEAIGYEVGFNSRAAFYRAFKKYTGTSPTSYISNK